MEKAILRYRHSAQTLNAMDDKIKYTIEISERELPFLYVLIKKDNETITTDIDF